MEQFLVPQFIDVEDKIIGPITVKQFIMMMAAGLMIFLEFRFFDFTLFLVLAILTLAALVILAFLKVNGRPSYYFLLHLVETLKRPRLRVWKKIPSKVITFDGTPVLVKKNGEETIQPGAGTPANGPSGKAGIGRSISEKAHPTKSQLTQLALLVDTGGLYGVEGETAGNP